MFSFGQAKHEIASAYFVSLVIIGVMFFLNIFLAILLQNFEADNELMAQKEGDGFGSKIMSNISGILEKSGLFSKKSTGLPSDKNDTSSAQLQNELASVGALLGNKESNELAKKFKRSISTIIHQKRAESLLKGNVSSIAVVPCEGRSLFCLGPKNPVRLIIHKVANSKIFENIVLVIIFASSIFLSFENPLNDPNGRLARTLIMSDIIFTSFFAFDCSLRIIANGFLFNGEYSYLRDPWNILDFLIVLMSGISLGVQSDSIKLIKVFRLARVLRPLRLVNRIKVLKIALHALVKAIPSILNVVLVSLLFFVIFGILGVNFFKGTFFSC
jgi:voltage-dependent calcium channel L type alpha-1D